MQKKSKNKNNILTVITLIALTVYLTSMIAIENGNWSLFWCLFGGSMTWFGLFYYANVVWEGAEEE